VRSKRILGEYIGEFVPFAAEDYKVFKDDRYGIHFNGPPYYEKRTVVEVGYTGRIAILNGGHRGAWSRFMNYSDVKREVNTELVHKNHWWAEQNRGPVYSAYQVRGTVVLQLWEVLLGR